jgi:hypothetical protein
MSILSALRTQTDSIDDLAALPQAMIMQMAQKKQIREDMIAPILARKAEMAEASARNQALKTQGQQPTVMEQLMQRNAVAEQKAPEQQTDVGIGQLPVNPAMFQEQSMAGGGIVAFADGGDIDDESEQDQDDYENSMISRILAGAASEKAANSGMVKKEEGFGISTKPAEGGTHAEFVARTASKYGLDPEYVNKIIAKETGGSKNPATAVSSAGAQGIMQLMPGTAKDMGVQDAFDPRQNIEGGVKYLALLEKKYGDPKLAAIAYNWGPGNTDKWLKAGADMAKLPKETQKYVATLAAGGAIRGYAAGDMVRASDSLVENESIIDPTTFEPRRFSFDDYMANLAEQRKQAKAGVADDKNLALLAAGLGMMGGTSPYAMANIGQGAMKGVEQYGTSKKLRAAEDAAISKAELGGLRAQELEEYRKERLKNAGANKDLDTFNTTLARINADPRVKSIEKQREKSMAEPGTPEYEFFDNSIEAIRDAYFKEAGIKNPRVRVQMPKAPAPKEKKPDFFDSVSNFFSPSSKGRIKLDEQGNPR